MPDTKPDLRFDAEGICDACRSFELRNQIDWDSRKDSLLTLLERYRSKNSNLGLHCSG